MAPSKALFGFWAALLQARKTQAGKTGGALPSSTLPISRDPPAERGTCSFIKIIHAKGLHPFCICVRVSMHACVRGHR